MFAAVVSRLFGGDGYSTGSSVFRVQSRPVCFSSQVTFLCLSSPVVCCSSSQFLRRTTRLHFGTDCQVITDGTFDDIAWQGIQEARKTCRSTKGPVAGPDDGSDSTWSHQDDPRQSPGGTKTRRPHDRTGQAWRFACSSSGH